MDINETPQDSFEARGILHEADATEAGRTPAKVTRVRATFTRQ